MMMVMSRWRRRRRRRMANYKVVVIVYDCTTKADDSRNYSAILPASLSCSTENRK
jgi:Ni2+-binding GTPase involved in maturation of urease and hydrogenase